MDPRALWLSTTFAAAKFAIALWFGQLALSALDRRRITLAWQIALSVALIVVSWWAVRTSGVPAWWRPVWIINSLVAASALVECVRRWLADASPIEQADLEQADLATLATTEAKSDSQSRGRPQRPQAGAAWVHNSIAAVGLGITTLATAAGVLGQLPQDTPARVAAISQSLVCAGMLGVALAVSFQLTIGATGQTLLQLNWRRVARWTSLGLLVQLVVSAVVIGFRRDAATPVESVTPIFFAFGMVIVSYIVWAIPKQMASLAVKGRMEGQASLAVASWLAALCLALACSLPPAWPWTQLNIIGRTSAQPVQPSR